MKYSKSSGFSLIEIMVVLVILTLLASVVAPNLLGRADEARVSKARADFAAIESALALYRLDNYNYPTSEQGLMALVEKPTMAPEPANWREEGYLEEAPVDPWGNEYLYLRPGQDGRKFDIFSYGADGVQGGDGVDADIGNWADE